MSKNNSIFDKVNNAIETIRPYLQADGGDVILKEVTDEMIVKVKLLGACEGCPFSIQTLKLGIEQAIKKAIPEIREVVTTEE